MSRTIKRQNVKFVTNDSGFAELLNSPEMQNEVRRLAEQRASSLTSGDKTYKVKVTTGTKRCHAYISADSPHAYYSNLKNNDLLKALL